MAKIKVSQKRLQEMSDSQIRDIWGEILPVYLTLEDSEFKKALGDLLDLLDKEEHRRDK